VRYGSGSPRLRLEGSRTAPSPSTIMLIPATNHVAGSWKTRKVKSGEACRVAAYEVLDKRSRRAVVFQHFVVVETGGIQVAVRAKRHAENRSKPDSGIRQHEVKRLP